MPAIGPTLVDGKDRALRGEVAGEGGAFGMAARHQREFVIIPDGDMAGLRGHQAGGGGLLPRGPAIGAPIHIKDRQRACGTRPGDGGEGRAARRIARQRRAGDDKRGEGGEVDPVDVFGCQGEIGSAVAVKDGLASLKARFGKGEGIARLTAHGPQVGGIDAIAGKIGGAEATHGIVRDAGTERSPRPLPGQRHGDIASRATDGGGEGAGLFDGCAGGIGHQVHPHSAKHRKAVERHALQGGVHWRAFC